MKEKILLITAFGIFAAWHSQADVLKLKGGKTLDGKYAGGTTDTVIFQTGEGAQTVQTSQILALSFGTAGTNAAQPAAAPSTAAAGAAAPAAGSAAGGSVSIPAGTPLLVRIVDPVSSKDPQGKRFTTTLDSDLVVNGTVVAKAGTKVY